MRAGIVTAEPAAAGPVAVGEPTRQFVTAVETQVATARDEAGMEQVLATQAAAGPRAVHHNQFMRVCV